LRGHNGDINSFAWSFDDMYIATCAQDGATYIWSLLTMKRENEKVDKENANMQIAFQFSKKNELTLLACDSKGSIKSVSNELKVKACIDEIDASALCVTLSGENAFVGTSSGHVCTCKLTDGRKPQVCYFKCTFKLRANMRVKSRCR
jgi:WD40 repeat protein